MRLRIYKSGDAQMDNCGIVVAAAVDVNDLVAYIDTNNMTHERVKEIGELIAADPCCLDKPNPWRLLKTKSTPDGDPPIVDLRGLGRPPRGRMPGFVYGLHCVPIDVPQAAPVQLTPYCHYLAADMQRHLAAMLEGR